MGLIIRLYDIESPHDFKIAIKSGMTAYSLYEGYVESDTIYSGGTTQIELSGITYPGGDIIEFDFDTQYWIKLIDTETNRYIIENIYTHNQIAFDIECPCSPPIITFAECYVGDLDCDLSLTAEEVLIV